VEPRDYMAMAIKAMRESQCEPRADDKASPHVGAVLVLADGTVDTACRGELRDGDHAEYTLLERKNQSRRLDGSTLYTTLEPCAPGSRDHPKLSCAERIINARVRKVWVGIEDPDPTVDRRGIALLQSAGVEVEMFDRDMQEQVRDANNRFIDQAMERAERADDIALRDSRLSVLESPLAGADLADLSTEALDEYRRRSAMLFNVGSAEFNHRLSQQGVLSLGADGRFQPTGFGLVLFGDQPRDSMPQAGLLATIQHSDGSEELEDFDGPGVLIPEAVEEWLSARLPDVVSRASSRRVNVPSLPFEMVREAVTNALVHRDYDLRGAKCQLVVTGDTVTVKSPGGPLPPITLEQLQAFSAPMLSRNPGLHYVFAKMELAEERGLGIKSLRDRAVQSGLPLPRYAWEDPYLVLSILRSAAASVAILPPQALESLGDRAKKGWEWASRREVITVAAYSLAMNITERTAQRDIAGFVDMGLLRKTGSGRSTAYHLV
jgi:ATP-dependent DNA helicase RecG